MPVPQQRTRLPPRKHLTFQVAAQADGLVSTERAVRAGSRAPACGLFWVCPWHRRWRAPPLREFNARLLWSAAALRNVSPVLETHTRASEKERPHHSDYVFDQYKHVEEIKERAHGKAWRNESLLCQDLHNFIDVLHGDKQLQVGQPLLICFLFMKFRSTINVIKTII